MKLKQYTIYTLYWLIVWNVLNLLGFIVHKDVYTLKAALVIGVITITITLLFKFITMPITTLIKSILTFQSPKHIS